MIEIGNGIVGVVRSVVIAADAAAAAAAAADQTAVASARCCFSCRG